MKKDERSMLIKFTSLEPVKSISQRALARYWDGLAAGRRFPAFTEFKLEPGMHDPKQLVVWNVEGEGPHLKFRALYQARMSRKYSVQPGQVRQWTRLFR